MIEVCDQLEEIIPEYVSTYCIIYIYIKATVYINSGFRVDGLYMFHS